MDYTSLTVTGLIFDLNPLIPVIGCTAVGIRSKTIEIKITVYKLIKARLLVNVIVIYNIHI